MDTNRMSALSAAPSAVAGHTVKIWGSSQVLYRDRRLELVRATICRGGYCSRHHHRFKSNGFCVGRGRLLLIVYEGGKATRWTLVPDGRLTVVAAGVDHRFVALEEETQLYELYTAVEGAALDPEDIVPATWAGGWRRAIFRIRFSTARRRPRPASEHARGTTNKILRWLKTSLKIVVKTLRSRPD